MAKKGIFSNILLKWGFSPFKKKEEGKREGKHDITRSERKASIGSKLLKICVWQTLYPELVYMISYINKIIKKNPLLLCSQWFWILFYRPGIIFND